MILAKLILAHILGDFFLQPKSWIEDKEKRKWGSPYLYIHTLIHFMLILLLLWDLNYWPVAMIIAVSHLFIDGVKVTAQTERTKSNWFGIDQFSHVLVIVAVWFFFWNGTGLAPPERSFWIILAGTLFLTFPSSFIMMNLMNRWNEQIDTDNDDSLDGAGKFIGILERLFVFIAILGGHLQVIGFLLAAKSVFRFGDLTRAKNRKLTEYILIGTLLSFLIAITTGLIVMHFLD